MSHKPDIHSRVKANHKPNNTDMSHKPDIHLRVKANHKPNNTDMSHSVIRLVVSFNSWVDIGFMTHVSVIRLVVSFNSWVDMSHKPDIH
jgi:hypothetical protein